MFDSEGEEEETIGIEISFDSSIFKKRNKQSSVIKRQMGDLWKLQSPPWNSAPTRLHRCCFVTGRLRANYRDFRLSRHILREWFMHVYCQGRQDRVGKD